MSYLRPVRLVRPSLLPYCFGADGKFRDVHTHLSFRSSRPAQVNIMLFSIIINFNRLGAAILFHMFKLNKFKVIPGETATTPSVAGAMHVKREEKAGGSIGREIKLC